jgi:hypothetical protein
MTRLETTLRWTAFVGTFVAVLVAFVGAGLLEVVAHR